MSATLASNKVQAVRLDGTNQTVTISGISAATTNAVGARTEVVRVVADTSCTIAIGSAPIATTGSAFLPANSPEYFRVIPGVDKIAVIGSSGKLYVSECN